MIRSLREMKREGGEMKKKPINNTHVRVSRASQDLRKIGDNIFLGTSEGQMARGKGVRVHFARINGKKSFSRTLASRKYQK